MTDTIKLWTTELRTTHVPQAKFRLANKARIDGRMEVGACCLGILEAQREGCTVEDLSRSEALPPRAVAAYLGVEMTNPRNLGADRVDLLIDYTYDARLDWDDDEVHEDYEMWCSGLNDNLELTFSQIADMVDYFGIKRAEVMS